MFCTLAQLYSTCPHGWQMSAWNADNEEEMWDCRVAPKAPGRGTRSIFRQVWNLCDTGGPERTLRWGLARPFINHSIYSLSSGNAAVNKWDCDGVPSADRICMSAHWRKDTGPEG
ncbi:hypothetical protein IRJ41_014627 [Triplophysa rosa]|uniref:Uncharacterized protein n=1 Tax=Triplophysa rosa TaxID=992332 RepID=A0A9W7TMK0_TRIRA|nr:hypothetical protein IRJ41_014627 [Triplophysa rosa]